MKLKRQAEAGMAELDAVRSAIEAKVSAGLLSQVEGEQQLLATSPTGSVRFRPSPRGSTPRPGRPGQLLRRSPRPRALSDAVRDLGLTVEGARVSFSPEFGKAALDAGRDALTEFFDTGVTGATRSRTRSGTWRWR